MKKDTLNNWYSDIHDRYPYLTRENFHRLIMLFYGLDYKKQDSYPDPFTHYELIYTASRLSKIPVLTLLSARSPFSLRDLGNGGKKLLFYKQQFVDTVSDFEQRFFDMKKNEPFYFYVREVNGDLVLKLNPIQLCDFFQNPDGMRPCSFCFRNDMVSRFRNIKAADLVKLIIDQEDKKDKMKTLKSIDEISIVTGSYQNDDQYVKEIAILVKGIKPLVSSKLRVVVGSHEGRGKEMYQRLKEAGVSVFAFPVESLDDVVRKKEMKNRKGIVPMDRIITYIKEAVEIFGDDGVILRLVAGMGDRLTQEFEKRIEYISQLGENGPFWNINEYMPFTHYHWRKFQKKRPFTLEYLFAYCNIINKYVPADRQIRFKISP